MKKVLTRSFAIVMLLAMLVCLASCGGKDGIVGKWETSINYQQLMEKAALADASAEDAESVKEMLKMFDYSKVNMTLAVEYKEDGTYNVSVANAEEFIASVEEASKAGAKKMLESIAESVGMSVDDLAKEAGFDSLDAYIESSMNEEEYTSIVDEMKASGTYTVADGKLTHLGSGEEKDEIITYEISEAELKWTAIEGEGADENSLNALLPITWTKK